MKKDKIGILEINKNERRSVFTFPKEQKLFGIIRNILMKLGFENQQIFEFGCLYDEETEEPVQDEDGHLVEAKIERYNERIFNFINKEYSIDLIFFSKKVSMILNYNKDKQKEISKVFEGVIKE
jgi:hypothetical protein